jgi:polyisoprenoid-binding protein YceI
VASRSNFRKEIIIINFLFITKIKQNMKKVFLSFLAVASIATVSLTSSCNNKAQGDQAEVTDAQAAADTLGATYNADLAASTVGFIGYGVGKNHPGVFSLTDGVVSVQNGAVTGGKFTINIKSISMTEKESYISEKLVPHLLSPDFFDAEKFGTATFEITSVAPYTASATDSSVVDGANFTLSGNLTLKDSTKNVSFPAKLEVSETALSAVANFTIDRTQWGMSYGNDKSLKDKMIMPEVTIALNLKAAK